MRLVYIGIESGTEEGLRGMNKHTTPEMNLNAINILKKLGIFFEFGFMLFDPLSTFESVKSNLRFLKKICGDGLSSLPLAKMLPLADTGIEKELRSSHRLFGKPALEDYNFLESNLNEYYQTLSRIFDCWMFRDEGLLTQTRYMRFHLAVHKSFYAINNEFTEIEIEINKTVSDINLYFLSKAGKLADYYQTSENPNIPIHKIKNDIDLFHDEYKSRIIELLEVMKNQTSNIRSV